MTVPERPADGYPLGALLIAGRKWNLTLTSADFRLDTLGLPPFFLDADVDGDGLESTTSEQTLSHSDDRPYQQSGA
ncbi:MAG: hypothetical protein ACHQPI_09250 [Thermoanaerobaculia bacterium]